MNANDDNRSLIPLPDGSLANTAAGAQRIMSAMVGETLALARREDAAKPARSEFKIGECVYYEPDYRQILIWAKALLLEPEEVVWRLLQGGTVLVNDYGCLGVERPWTEKMISESLAFASSLVVEGKKKPGEIWDSFEKKFGVNAEFHLELLLWRLDEAEQRVRSAIRWNAVYAHALYERHEANFRANCEHRAPLKIRELRWDFDLLPIRSFEWVKGLDVWVCAEFSDRSGRRRHVETLSPQLHDVRRLECFGLGLKGLDLSGVPSLEELKCSGNEIENLDVSPLSRIKSIQYDSDSTRLIQRPDQHF